jgi:hypothetical protein
MKTLLYIFVFTCHHLFLNAQMLSIDVDRDSRKLFFKTGAEVIGYLNQKYKAGPCKAYTFSQKNTHYRNDSIIGTSNWFECIEFPDKFRIAFDSLRSGNVVCFKNDSSYRYKKAKVVKSSYNANTLLLLLGGMYYREAKEVNERLQKADYNISVLSEQKWRKQNVYVIGALKGDTASNQIWVSKKNWRVVRILEKMGDGHMMDMSFDEHKDHCKGYVETKVTFRRDGKVEQVEEYDNIKPVEYFPASTFNLVQ